MNSGVAGFLTFFGIFAAGQLAGFLATRRDREGMRPALHAWIAATAAFFALLVAIEVAGN